MWVCRAETKVVVTKLRRDGRGGDRLTDEKKWCGGGALFFPLLSSGVLPPPIRSDKKWHPWAVGISTVPTGARKLAAPKKQDIRQIE